MNKTETKLVRAEVRSLKKELNTRQKQTAQGIKNRRAIIRCAEREISVIERDHSVFEKSTNDRLAILEGRLNS